MEEDEDEDEGALFILFLVWSPSRSMKRTRTGHISIPSSTHHFSQSEIHPLSPSFRIDCIIFASETPNHIRPLFP